MHAVCLTATVSCVSFSAMAADTQSRGGRPIEEVIVTAQKQAERLQDVPVPVTAIDAGSLVANNALRLEDYYGKVPGLGLALAGNGSEPQINIRGITTGGPQNPTVGIVIDEMPYGPSVAGVTPAAPDIDPSELSRVEVLRGPQGTLYGASSIGGLLKFATVDPSTDALSGRVQVGSSSVSHGDDFGYSVRGAINAPLGDTLAIRASGFTSRDPGYVDNLQTGQQDVNERHADGGHLSALWQPSSAFTLKLNALVQDTERLGSPDVDLTVPGELNQRGLRGTGIYDRDTDAYSGTMIATLGAVELTSVTGYSVDELRNNQDLSGNVFQRNQALTRFGVTGVSVPLTIKTDKFSEELRAAIPLGERIDWLIGAFYTDEDIQTNNDVAAVDPATGNVVGLILRNSIPTTFEEYAAFTNVTFKLSDVFDVQVGGRYSENRQHFSLVRSGPLALQIFGSDPFVSPVVHSKDSSFTYLLTPRWRISPDVMVYARLASGYRPGGPNINCGVAPVCEYDADTTQNYEVGIKGDVLDHALTLDASVYYIAWDDIQVQGVLPNNLTYTDNGNGAKSQGIELSFNASPLEGLSLSGWAAYSEAELTEPFPSTSLNTVGNAGDRLPYSSRTSGSFSADQEFPLWSTATGVLGASVTYVGDRKGLFKRAGQVRETFPSYTQVDARVGLRYESWTIDAFVNNITDKRGVLRAGLDSISPTLITYIQPRTVGLSFAKTF